MLVPHSLCATTETAHSRLRCLCLPSAWPHVSRLTVGRTNFWKINLAGIRESSGTNRHCTRIRKRLQRTIRRFSTANTLWHCMHSYLPDWTNFSCAPQKTDVTCSHDCCSCNKTKCANEGLHEKKSFWCWHCVCGRWKNISRPMSSLRRLSEVRKTANATCTQPAQCFGWKHLCTSEFPWPPSGSLPWSLKLSRLEHTGRGYVQSAVHSFSFQDGSAHHTQANFLTPQHWAHNILSSRVRRVIRTVALFLVGSDFLHNARKSKHFSNPIRNIFVRFVQEIHKICRSSVHS